MAKFFTTASDLLNWVKTQNQTPAEAADKLHAVIGSNQHAVDIAESTKRIFSGANSDHASEVLFSILSQYDITEETVKTACSKVGEIYAANELLKSNLITADQHGKLVKEAQMIREPGQMQFGMRVCPKLPLSVASRRVSQYTCTHYCTASMVLDDEPERVYCMEALWRKHVMDKFSRDIKDPKTGKLVGGYINNRFYRFPTAGTPANPDAPRDGGNPMELKPGERSRQAKPHEWSIERRMQEQRDKDSTKSITLNASSKEMIKTAGLQDALLKQASVVGFTKLSAEETFNPSHQEIAKVFTEAIDLENAGVSLEDASVRLAKAHNLKIAEIVKIQEMALKKLAQHQADVYLLEKSAAQLDQLTEPSALQSQLKGGNFVAGQDIVIGQDTIVEGTRLVKNPNKESEYTVLGQDDKPLKNYTLNPEEASKLINPVDTDMIGLTETNKNVAVQQASLPNQGEPASVPTTDENAPTIL